MDADRQRLVAGSVVGALAWILGYLSVFLITAPSFQDSILDNVSELFQGEPSTIEFVGWVFYNAHFVETIFVDYVLVPTGSGSYIGGDARFTPLLYLIPIGILVATGIANARMAGAVDLREAVLAGASVVGGYFLPSLIGVFAFTVETAEGTISPDLLPAVVLAGVVYPALCGGVGGAIAGFAPS